MAIIIRFDGLAKLPTSSVKQLLFTRIENFVIAGKALLLSSKEISYDTSKDDTVLVIYIPENEFAIDSSDTKELTHFLSNNLHLIEILSDKVDKDASGAIRRTIIISVNQAV